MEEFVVVLDDADVVVILDDNCSESMIVNVENDPIVVMEVESLCVH